MAPSAAQLVPRHGRAITFDFSYPNTIEPKGKLNEIRRYIDLGYTSEQVIRIWINYRDIDDPNKQLAQNIFLIWDGRSSFGYPDTQNQQIIEKYFEKWADPPK